MCGAGEELGRTGGKLFRSLWTGVILKSLTIKTQVSAKNLVRDFAVLMIQSSIWFFLLIFNLEGLSKCWNVRHLYRISAMYSHCKVPYITQVFRRFPDHAHIGAGFPVELGAWEHVRIPGCARHKPHHHVEKRASVQRAHSPLQTWSLVGYFSSFNFTVVLQLKSNSNLIIHLPTSCKN